jgi:hypothetical protein
VLLTTGFTTSARDVVEQGFVLLQKPFDLAALEQALGELHAQQQNPKEQHPEQRAAG